MPLFGTLRAAAASMYERAANVVSAPCLATQQIRSMLQHSNDSENTEALISLERRAVKHLSLDCKQLSTRVIQILVQEHKYSELLQKVIEQEDSIKLHTRHNNVDMFTASRYTKEYLALSCLFNPSSTHTIMAALIRDAFNALLSTSHACHPSAANANVSIDKACIFIENIVFNRCPSIKQRVDYRLMQYVDINEMLQLICMLQTKVDNLSFASAVRLTHEQQVNHHDDTDERIESHAESINDERNSHGQAQNDNAHNYAQAARALLDTENNTTVASALVRHIRVTDIAIAYARAPGIIEQELYAGIHGVNGAMDFDVLVATQVFAAFAAHDALYYEMQRSFNDTREIQLDALLQYARQHGSLRTEENTTLEQVAHNLLQVRMAHAVRTHYMYNMLEEFVYSFFAPDIEQLSAHNCLQLRIRAKIATLFIGNNLADEIALEVMVKLMQYAHAAVLIHIVNECDNVHDRLQVDQCLQRDTAFISTIAQESVEYALNAYMKRIALKKVAQFMVMTQEPQDILFDMIDNMCPQQDSDVMRYLVRHTANMLESLPNVYFNELITQVVPILTQQCTLQLEHNEQQQEQQILVTRTHDHRLNIDIVYSNILHVMRLMSQCLPSNIQPTLVMTHAIKNIYTQISNTIDIAFLEESIFNSHSICTHAMYVLTSVLMRQIHNVCVSRVQDYGIRMLAICGCALVAAGSQYISKFIFGAIQSMTDAILSVDNSELYY